MSHGTWTDFLSPSNEVFVPDDRAWAGTDNVVDDDDESGDMGSRWVGFLYPSIHCMKFVSDC